MLCNMPFEIKAGLLGDDARLIRGTLQPAVFPLGGCGCFCTSSTTLAESASVALLYSFSKRVLSSQAKPCFKGVLLLDRKVVFVAGHIPILSCFELLAASRFRRQSGHQMPLRLRVENCAPQGQLTCRGAT